jgi:alkanesulfonate monooxygenase SsuD/methylene tetrahydromethanopterin reductase-like flavin-dependent oxidoreductase (luciferase family)
MSPLPPRWTTVLGTGAAGAAAARGFKICTGFLPVPEVRIVFDAYQDAVGARCPERMGLRRQVFIAESDSEAVETAAEAEAAWRRAMGERRTQAHGLVPDAPAHDPLAFMFGPGEQINGSPASVADQIIAQCEATGAGHFMAFVFGTIARRQIERNYALWRQVIPVLRKAGAA